MTEGVTQVPRKRRRLVVECPDGLSEKDVESAMFCSMKKMVEAGYKKGLIGLSAGNYGGKLGPHHFYLEKILKANGI